VNFSLLTRNGKAKPATAGLHGQLTRAAYDLIPAVSNTVIKKWDELESTPTEFAWWLKDRWEDTESSSALSKGSALDCLLLEYEQFPKRFHVFTKDGPKRITAKHRADTPDKIVLSHDEFQEAVEMAKALQGSPHTSFGEDFKACSKQVAVTKLFGAPFKCEFDLWADDTENISDIKSARSVSKTAFGKAFVDFGYDFQASLYLAIARDLGFDKRAFNFLCVKNSAPYTVKPYRFRPFDNPKHQEIYNGCLARVGQSVASLLEALSNNFAEDLRWEDLTIPEWSVRQRSADALLLA
jgi:PDDEXK-like domain of unknown function (DUF3799)